MLVLLIEHRWITRTRVCKSRPSHEVGGCSKMQVVEQRQWVAVERQWQGTHTIHQKVSKIVSSAGQPFYRCITFETALWDER